MSRRQALGLISNSQAIRSTSNQPVNENSSKLASLKSMVSSSTASLYNDENERPPGLGTTIKTSKPSEFEFEIFQEDQIDTNAYKATQVFEKFQTQSQCQEVALKRKENKLAENVNELAHEQTAKLSSGNLNKENRDLYTEESKKKIHDANQECNSQDEKKQEEACCHRKHDSEYDDEEDYEDVDDDEYDDDDDDDNNDDRVEEEEEEEEGISRLNLNIIEASNDTFDNYESSRLQSVSIKNSEKTKKESNISSELIHMMDSSIHNESSSPMMLDDTIKFQSVVSATSYDEENENEEVNHDVLDNGDCCRCMEADDDELEELNRKLTIQEDEHVLMSCIEFRDDILEYMRTMEIQNRPKPNYMRKQQDINASMRSILIDWLVEVSEEYKLNQETLYLAVNYTDRFLSQMSVLRGKLQLVGTACMYIASKYEEITPPDVAEFVYITDDTYTRKQVLRMEHLLLKVLDFHMSTPTINSFIIHFINTIKFNNEPNKQRNYRHLQYCKHNNNEPSFAFECMVRYAAELTLIDCDTFLNYLPSQIAASAVYIAMLSFKKQWTKQIADTIGYSFDLSELKPCICHMYKALREVKKHPQQAIFEKYKQSKYKSVASRELPELPFQSSFTSFK
jgi:cyclin-A